MESVWQSRCGCFFVISGFLYTREANDTIIFWKKKLSRIVLPWVCCSSITYVIAVALGGTGGIISYFKWIFGSGTWYYYVTVYIFFLIIFKWFYDKDIVLVVLMGIQMIAISMASFGKTTTISLGFFTDYLNPLHWIGYFSLGILTKKYRLDIKMRMRKYTVLVAAVLAILSMLMLCYNRIFTYFHIGTSIFCLSMMVIVAAVAYRTATCRIAKQIEKVGTYSYCIYLLHMQIVQGVLLRIPENVVKLVLSPFVGLSIMLMLISLGLLICKKLPFGEKLKAMVGL